MDFCMKKVFKFIVPIFCIVIVALTFYFIFKIEGKVEEKYYNTDNISVNNFENTNIIKDDEDNIERNK